MACMFSLHGNSSTSVSKLSSPFKAKCINTRRKINRQIGVNASSKSSGKSYKITLLSGDGIGPEVTRVAKDVLQLVASREDVNFNFKEMLLGGAAIDATGVPLPEETLAACQLSDAVLLATVGGYKWDNNEHHLRPEYGLLQLRSKLGVFANLRPAIVFPQLVDVSALKPDVVSGVDFMIIRELTGGIYFANPKGYGTNENGEKIAFNTEVYSSSEVDRIARVAFDIARKRGKQLCSVDKANVLEVSQFWRERVIAISDGYQDVQLSHMYVDIAATQLIRNPKQFDTIVTNNVFGDILSEEASVLTGSSAMLPSACVGESGPGIFEPRHESSPDIANQLDKANPLAMILSAAMMLKYGLCEDHAAVQIERAVICTLDKGFRTADLMSPGKTLVGCAKMGEEVMKSLETL